MGIGGILDKDGNMNGIGDTLVVLARLRAAHGRRDDHHSVGAVFLGLPAVVHGLGRGGAARVDDHRHTATRLVDDRAGDEQALFVRELEDLTAQSHPHAMHAVGNAEIDEVLQAFHVNALLLVERGDQDSVETLHDLVWHH